MTHIVAGNAAPGFSLKAVDGKEYSLDKLTQQGPVVATFFKVSCPVCQFTFPYLERLYKRYGGDGVTFLGISQDDASDTKEFAKEFGTTFPMVLDEKQKETISAQLKRGPCFASDLLENSDPAKWQHRGQVAVRGASRRADGQ